MSFESEEIENQYNLYTRTPSPCYMVSEDRNYSENICNLLHEITPFVEDVINIYSRFLPRDEAELGLLETKVNNLSQILHLSPEHLNPVVPQTIIELISLEAIDTERLAIVAQGKPLYQTDLDRILKSPYGAHTELLLRQVENYFSEYPNGKFQLDRNDQEELLLRNLDIRDLKRRPEEKMKAWEERIARFPEQSRRIENALFNCNIGLIYRVIKHEGYYGDGVFSNGSLGLLYAIRQYNLLEGSFSNFAIEKIRGALRDAINSGEENDMPHPGRNIKVKYDAIKKKALELNPKKELKALSDSEIKDVINSINWKKRGIPEVETIRAILKIGSMQIIDLNELEDPFDEDSNDKSEQIVSDFTDWDKINEQIDSNKKYRKIFQKVDELIKAKLFSPVYKEIIYLRYVEEWTLKRIAEKYNVKIPAIEQKVNRALTFLTKDDIDS